METLKTKFSSRKFLLCLGAIFVVVGTYLQGASDVTALIVRLRKEIAERQSALAALEAVLRPVKVNRK